MSQLDQVVFSLMMSGVQKHCRPFCLKKLSAELTNDQKDCLAACQDKFIEQFKVAFERAAGRFAGDMQKERAAS